jgi:predicted transcriptional regulator
MITRALYNKLHSLAIRQRFTKVDAEELQEAIRQTINPRYTVCLKCAQQLKHGQRIILNYLEQTQVIEDIPQVVEETIFEMAELPTPEVDEVEADKVGCTKCKRKVKSNM